MVQQGISPPRIDPLPWREWVDRHFRDYFPAPFAERHVRFWEWAAALTPGARPRPRVEVWGRGGGKSTTIEGATAWLGSQPQPSRHYVLYVSETQEQADKHVQAVAAMMEHVGIKRAINEYGASKGWRHSEIRAANGFNCTAFGLDAGMRGVKLDKYRPDVILFDDIDSRHDTEATIRKKIETITTTILPAGSPDCAVIVVQNKIHEDSIVSRLCDGRADFLHDREPATVEPAVRDLQVERTIDDEGMPRYVITGGTATWDGQSLGTCEQQINSWGLTAFEREAQHEVAEVEGGLWNVARDITPFRHDTRRLPVPEMHRIVVGVDPNSDGGDDAGIVVCGISKMWDGYWRGEDHAYVLADRTVTGGPETWAAAAVAAYRDFQADSIVAEKNNGGQMISITIGTIPGAPSVNLVHASRGKRTRAEPVQHLYSQGRVHHVGIFPELEKELARWEPKPNAASPNRLDACFVAGTLVTTHRGDIPIEDVQIGDHAKTRAGWKPVTNCGQTFASTETITVQFSDGRSLTGTPNHPVFTHNRGFVPLDALVWSDILETGRTDIGGASWQAEKTSSSSTESPSSGIPTARPRPLVATTCRTTAVVAFRAWEHSIRRFGSRFMARFRRDTTSTTATATRSTIPSTTSNVSQKLSIQPGMLLSIMTRALHMLTAFGHLLPSGTGAKRGEHGTASTESGHGAIVSRWSAFALSVATRINHCPGGELTGSALGGASLAITSEIGRTTRTGVAAYAAQLSPSNDQRSSKHARVCAVRSYASGSEPVYNLEVSGQPEYFANGVLVHNCTWAITDLMLDTKPKLRKPTGARARYMARQ